MENNERQENKLTIDRDTPIQIMVNHAGAGDEVEIDLGRVFHTMKLKWRLFAWVLVLCLTVGACAPLVMYQFTKEPLTVSSVVTLVNYEIPASSQSVEELRKLVEQGRKDEIAMKPVDNLTAPDWEPLDLDQITSAYVLQTALDGLTLSQNIGASQLRSGIGIQRILSESSAQRQELVSTMLENKSADAYEQAAQLSLNYVNRFVVTLTNGFGEENSRHKLYLTDEELRQLLDRVLAAYNDYLVETYADHELPVDEISMIDVEDIDLLESLDQLRLAVNDLYTYCDEKPETVKTYRSWRTGRSLTDWMETLETLRDSKVEYLYAYVYTNSIAKDSEALLTNYRYQLQEAQTELDAVRGDIDTVNRLLKEYKNDEIYVQMQESDAVKSTKATTDYYNALILEQPVNYGKAAKLESTITDLQDKINIIERMTYRELAAQQAAVREVEAELQNAISASYAAFEAINAHMEELMGRPLYNTYTEHSAAMGKTEGFLSASMKKVLIGLAVGALVAFGLWFLAGLAPEFTRRREEDGKDPKANGKEAAER